MPLVRPLFSRLVLLLSEDPAHRGIMDFRDCFGLGTRRRAVLELATLPLLLPLPDGGLAFTPARVCRRGLTGMVQEGFAIAGLLCFCVVWRMSLAFL